MCSGRSQSPAYLIAHYRVPHRLGNNESKAGITRSLIVHDVNNAVRCRITTSTTHSQAKITRMRYAVRLSQHRTRLRGEFGASLAATCAQDGATGTSAHTQTETVDLRTATVVRLESSLAHSYISKAQRWRPGRIGRPEGRKSTDSNYGVKGVRSNHTSCNDALSTQNTSLLVTTCCGQLRCESV